MPSPPSSSDSAVRTASTSVTPSRASASEQLAAVVQVVLQVAGLGPDPERELGHDPPPEILEPVARRVPCREDGRAESLGVSMRVADGGPQVVGGHDPLTLPVDPPDHDDAAQERQLVLREADRRTAERFEDVFKGVAGHRRSQSVTDGRGANGDASLLTPGEGRQAIRQLGRDQDRVIWPNDRAVDRDRPAGPAEVAGLGQPFEGLVRTAQLSTAQVGRKHVEERCKQGRPRRAIVLCRPPPGEPGPRAIARASPPGRHRAGRSG